MRKETAYKNGESRRTSEWHRKRRAEQRRAKVGERTCLVCGDAVPYRHVKSYCSRDCRQRAYMGMGGVSLSRSLGISSGAIGGAHELIVAADLVKRGMFVFRAVTQHAPCDIAILDGPNLWRVEVKTGYRARTGRLYHTPTTHDGFDILAVVEASGRITYSPQRDEKTLSVTMTRIEGKRLALSA